MNVAGFTPEFGKRIKQTVEAFSPGNHPPGKAFDGRAAHAAFSSPVEIEGEWTQDDTNTAWHCSAKKVVFRDEKYVAATDAVELYDPCATEKPAYAPGDRVYAVYRGRWELVSGGTGGGGSPMVPGTLTTNLTQNSALSAMATVKLEGTETSVTAYAYLLNSGETLSKGRRVWMTRYKNRYEIVSASCPEE